MSVLSSGLKAESSLLNLKAIDIKDVRQEVYNLLVSGESIISAFKTIRDQVVFTDKRIFVINVQGVTGKKTSFFSYPYSKVQYFAIETAGVLDIDSELILTFSNGSTLELEFKSNVDIRSISQAIAHFIL